MVRRLERFEKQQKALGEAVAMLDRGESMERVRAKAGEALGDGFADLPRDGRERRDGRPVPGRGDRSGFPDTGAPPWQREGAPGRPGAAPGGPPPVSEETILEVIKEVFPGAHDRLQRLREQDPEQFRAMLDRMRPRIGQFIRWRLEDPDIWKLRAEVFRKDREADHAAERAAFGAEAERRVATDRLRTLLDEIFDLHQRIAESDVKRLGARVEKLRAEISERGANREQIVEARLGELIEGASERQPRRPCPGAEGDGAPPGPAEDRPASPR